jgi:hypothetical protein
MGYHLSRKNARLLAPYLRILESTKKDITFNISNPQYFREQVRNAFATTHVHLRDKFNVRVTASQVLFTYLDIQVELQIDRVISTSVDMLEIAQHIMENSVPVRFTKALLIPEEIESLKNLAQSKNIVLSYNSPILELTEK